MFSFVDKRPIRLNHLPTLQTTSDRECRDTRHMALLTSIGVMSARKPESGTAGVRMYVRMLGVTVTFRAAIYGGVTCTAIA